MLAMEDLFLRHGYEWKLEPEAFWKVMEPFVSHLAEHAAEWWIAEDRTNGTLIGYARSVERDGLFEPRNYLSGPTNNPPAWENCYSRRHSRPDAARFGPSLQPMMCRVGALLRCRHCRAFRAVLIV